MSADPRRRACDDLARLIATEEGLYAYRLRQIVEALGSRAEKAESPQPAATPAARRIAMPRSPVPVPIGPWRPERQAGKLIFQRPPSPPGDPWPPETILEPRSPDSPKRVVFLGESAAAGWFYAPHMTPARVLADQLATLAGPEAFEVTNLAKVDLTSGELLTLAPAAMQLRPDVVVVFAGNNWPQRFRNVPPQGFAGSLEAALAYRQGGMAGLARHAEEAGLQTGEAALRRLAEAAAAAGAAVVVVVPEVNLGDWERARPPIWLPGSQSAAWHAAHARAVALLSDGQLEEALRAALEMIEADGGTCSTSHRLRAAALDRLGRTAEAAQACRAEVDARSWDNVPQAPGSTSAVQALLRRAAVEHGFGLVDLTEVFPEHAATPLLGRRFFLDYCHLSLEGMKVSMAAVAAQVLRLASQEDLSWRDVIGRVPDPVVDPRVEGRAQFMAALYNAHWAAPADGAAPDIRAWLDASLASSEGTVEMFTRYVSTRSAPADALLLSSDQQVVFAAPGRAEHHIWSAVTLDADTLVAIERALASRGAAPSWDHGGLLRRHGVQARGSVDLLQEIYHWRPADQAATNPAGPYAALWPRSRFCLVSQEGLDVALEVVARLPRIERERSGDLRVEVNGLVVATIPLGMAWRRCHVAVPGHALRSGVNELALLWPPLPAEGDAALAYIGRRLDLRISVELHPVFGEIATLVAAVSGGHS